MPAPIIANKYALLKKLASGGMAEVFLAKQIGLDGFEKLVVLKRILPHLAEDEEFVQMFLDEARTAADLRHPNVVNVFEVGEDEGTFYIAMEFLHGKDIRRTQRKVERLGQEFPLQHSLQIIIDAANGLHYAHQKTDLRGQALGIIHRDVSPQNIIITYDGAAKIVDFGIAKAASSTNQTASGVLKGKYSYMSPEQASAHPMDQRTDLFALGVVAYEMITMRRLFKRESEIHTLNAVIECKVPPPSQIAPYLPKALDAIMLKALHPRQEKRYASCQDFAFALEELLSEERLVHSQARVGKFMQSIFREEILNENSSDAFTEDSSLSAIKSPSVSKWNSITEKQQPATKTIRLTQEENIPDSLGLGPTRSTDATRTNDIDPHAKTAVTRTVQDQSRSVNIQTLENAPTRFSSKSAVAWLGLIVVGISLGIVGFFGFGNPSSYSELILKTTPSGAQITVDGQVHHQTSPSIIKGLDRGEKHAISVQLEGYETESLDFVFEPDQANQTMNLRLAPLIKYFTLDLKSRPSGAEVYNANGQKLGMTPLAIAELRAGTDHRLTIRKSGYITLEEIINLKQDQALNLQLKAVPSLPSEAKHAPSKSSSPKVINQTPGRLKVLVKPWAEVFINGKRIGETPFKPVQLPPGTYKVKLVNPQIKKSVTKTIRIKPGKDISIHKW